MDRRPPMPPEAASFNAQDVDAFGDYLRSMVDPGTPEEIAAFNESMRRVAENTKVLLNGLPPSTGEFEGLRMGEATGPVELTPGQEVPPDPEAWAQEFDRLKRGHLTPGERDDERAADEAFEQRFGSRRFPPGKFEAMQMGAGDTQGQDERYTDPRLI